MIVKDLLDSCNIENVTSVIMEIASVDKSDRLSVKKHILYTFKGYARLNL